jgi:hypothetical protein
MTVSIRMIRIRRSLARPLPLFERQSAIRRFRPHPARSR